LSGLAVMPMVWPGLAVDWLNPGDLKV